MLEWLERREINRLRGPRAGTAAAAAAVRFPMIVKGTKSFVIMKPFESRQTVNPS